MTSSSGSKRMEQGARRAKTSIFGRNCTVMRLEVGWGWGGWLQDWGATVQTQPGAEHDVHSQTVHSLFNALKWSVRNFAQLLFPLPIKWYIRRGNPPISARKIEQPPPPVACSIEAPLCSIQHAVPGTGNANIVQGCALLLVHNNPVPAGKMQLAVVGWGGGGRRREERTSSCHLFCA